MDLIVPQQRMYVRSHPVVFWLCIGIVIVGALGLVAPSLIGQSAASMALPPWLRTLFYADYTAGALLAVVGIARAKASLEASGMVLLSAGFLVQFLSLLYLLPSSAFAGSFLATLAIGCFLRGRFLAKHGYPPRTVK